ncbi:phosphoribosylglycinamide formyltransferase [Sinimarinibacterium thermocellulolyticum]|uniref:Phosphoribosylglycinamide formyltransferase n=1 Tax=Sinimarinibacterium thermocellulolyticum TaxID=3170016 RepID=A0ABV2ABG0_9GAMM
MSARIAVLISGRGRNLQAIAAACADGRIPGAIVGVISSRADAAGLAFARAHGLHAEVLTAQQFGDRAAYDDALARRLDALQPDVIALAGFMRILTPELVARFLGRMVNVHPSLLPRYRGLDTHRRVLDAGETEHGASVHFVTAELDGGPVIIQGQLTVRAQDTPDTLAERVMNEIELRIYPQVVAWLARGELALRGERVILRGVPLARPLTLDALEEAFR